MHPNFKRVPASKGVPITVHIVTLLGLVVIYIIGGAVVLNSSYGHAWPSENTQRVNLGK